MAAAALGLAAGLMLAGGLSAAGGLRGWARSIRVIAWAGAMLSAAGIAVSVLERVSNGSAPLTPPIGAALIALGGAAYTILTKTTRFTLLTSGLLLTYASLGLNQAGQSPRAGLADAALVAAGAITLPALDASVRTWRHQPPALSPGGLWLVTALALVTRVWTNLIETGAWLGSSGASAWLAAAWMCAGGSLLARQTRARAALLLASALALGFGALGA